KIIRIFVSLFILTTILLQTSAQSGTLKGIVLDYANKESISGASIFLLNNKTIGTSTDENGNYSVQLSVGSHSIVCAYLGFKSDTFTVLIEPEKISVYNVLM